MTAVAAPRARRHRRWPWLVLAAAILVLPALLISPLLICGRTYSVSPDGAHSLCLVRGLMPFAMPGQGGDAPGYVVLRGRDGLIEGVVSLDMVSAIAMPTQWSAGTVAVPLALELALPSPDWPLPLRALVDWSWRTRAALGLVPHDTDFR